MTMSQRATLFLCLLVGVAGYREGSFEQNHIELKSNGAIIKKRMDERVDRYADNSMSTALVDLSSTSNGTAGPLDETPQGLQDDCTVELVPQARLREFHAQLKEYLTEMIDEFVEKTVDQNEEHEIEANRIQREMDMKTRQTKQELIHIIRSYTIEQQRLMVMTRHSISGFCCCNKDFDKNLDGKLSVQEVNEFLEAGNDAADVCRWVPKTLKTSAGTDDALQGLRNILCPDKFRWQYRDVIGSGAKVSAFQVDRLVDDCITSENWQEFVAGKKTVAHLNKQMKEQR